MKQKFNLVVCFAILTITFLEILALMNGINGTILRLSLILIAGLAGWRVPTDILRNVKGGIKNGK